MNIKKQSMKNHFFFGYNGNKRNEVNDIYNYTDDKIENIKTIIEPYCGTSAFSFFLAKKYPQKFNYILNDNNNYIIELYKIASDDELLNNLINELNDLIIDLDKEKYKKIIAVDNLKSYIISHRIYCIRPGLFPLNYKGLDFAYLKTVPIINFLKTENITFLNIDGIDIIKQYQNMEDALIFIDPPYLVSDNSFYKDARGNIYEYLSYNRIGSFKSFIVLALEYNWIINLLFLNDVKLKYDKLYQTSKKKTTHLIISNR